MAKASTLTAANFESEVLKSEKLVIVDYWAEWCMPCKMINPLLDDLADEFGDRIAIGKVNVDDEGDLTQEYGVVSIPTLLFFKNGALVKQQVGAVPYKSLRQIVEGLLS